MNPNIITELQTNTLLNPDFGMSDEGVLMHLKDVNNGEMESQEGKVQAESPII